VYASDRDFVDGQLASANVIDRLDRAVGQLEPHLRPNHQDLPFSAKIERWRGTANAAAAVS